jgi:hypothetical protein
MLRRTIAVAGLLLVLCGCRDAAAPAHVARWRDDLAFLERELPARHLNLYARLPEAEWHAGFATLRAELPRLTDAQILVRAMALVVAVGDGHTRLAEPPGGGFAVKLAWFDDGLFVIGVARSSSYRGSRSARSGSARAGDAALLGQHQRPRRSDRVIDRSALHIGGTVPRARTLATVDGAGTRAGCDRSMADGTAGP